MSELEQRADAWVGEYRDHHHLRRTRDWLLELEPAADEALRLAALTHDMERHFPGGPIVDPAGREPDDPGYNAAHQDRSAEIVGGWLREQGAADDLADDVAHLIRRHELGGDPRQDLLQAADSLSFLETKRDLMLGWLRDGRCDRERALRQPRWMYDRIRLERARPLARPLLEETLAAIEAAG
ncbi:MAG: DUF4202 family protein [Thermoleophilia bacterium]